jgi:hypothetical protein
MPFNQLSLILCCSRNQCSDNSVLLYRQEGHKMEVAVDLLHQFPPISLALTLSKQHVVGRLIIVRQLKGRRRILNHVYHSLCQGTVPILTLLKSLLNVTLFQLFKRQANVINIMIIRWGVLILSGGYRTFRCYLFWISCISGHHIE